LNVLQVHGFFELDLIEVMSVFFFACTKQKANGKEESAKAGLVTFKRATCKFPQTTNNLS